MSALPWQEVLGAAEQGPGPCPPSPLITPEQASGLLGTLIGVCQHYWGCNVTAGLSLPCRPATVLRPQRPQPGQIQSCQSAGRCSTSVHHWVRSCLGYLSSSHATPACMGLGALLQCPPSRVSLCPPEAEHWTQPSATCAPTVFKPSLLGQEDPWRRKWQPTPVFLSGKSHGQRSLAGYSPWSLKRVGPDWATEQQ